MSSAPHPIFALEPGALVEIQYVVVRHAADAADTAHRWVPAEVIVCEDDTWPLARLNDGQVTEIRPYMTWRLIHPASGRLAA